MNNDAREQELNEQFENTAPIIDPIVRDLTNELIALFTKYNKRIQKNHGTRDHHQLTDSQKALIKGAAFLAGFALTFIPGAGPVLGPLVGGGGGIAAEVAINRYQQDLNKKIDNAWRVRDHLTGEDENVFFQQVAFHVINNNRHAVDAISNKGKWAAWRLKKDLAANTIAALKQDGELDAPVASKIQTTSAAVNEAIQDEKSLSKKSSHRTLFTRR